MFWWFESKSDFSIFNNTIKILIFMHITLINCVKFYSLYISHHCIPDYQPQSNAKYIYRQQQSCSQKIIQKNIQSNFFAMLLEAVIWRCIINLLSITHVSYVEIAYVERSVMLLMMWAIVAKKRVVTWKNKPIC